jgi:hypothetical protein
MNSPHFSSFDHLSASHEAALLMENFLMDHKLENQFLGMPG